MAPGLHRTPSGRRYSSARAFVLPMRSSSKGCALARAPGSPVSNHSSASKRGSGRGPALGRGPREGGTSGVMYGWNGANIATVSSSKCRRKAALLVAATRAARTESLPGGASLNLPSKLWSGELNG
eukprot:CAMPEP_0177779104 /NCGR_PEP_ID=MMETSP0491_2-20121128/16375_1 /TAXON_ID=63592 /ORGANISM="Tetraselmis chuii, Strain PLY429" /LENGTH=125 /DNA_ID=CAMNT_0019298553 /DNA_START=476 /DNA_END=850 /DNA_ORIENTATION=+